MLWRNYKSFLLFCVHSSFSKHLQCRKRGLNVWLSENHCVWGRGLWMLLPSIFQSPQGTRAVISEHPAACWIFGAVPLHYLCILLPVLKVLWKTDPHRHFAMQLPLKPISQELRDTFFKETFILCYLPKGYGLHFLNNPQQRRWNQSWPDPTECLQWHMEIQLSAAKSEVVRKIKAKIITLLMCSCFHLSTKQGYSSWCCQAWAGPSSVTITWSRSFRKAILLVTSSWARSSFSCSSLMLASWSLRFSLCGKKGTTRKGN